MRFVRQSVLVGAVVMLAVATAACGSSSSGSGNASSAASQSVSTTATQASTAVTTTSTGSGASDSGFCGQAKAESAKLKTQLQGMFTATTGPAALKKLMTTLDAAYQRLGNEAPADIKPAFVVVFGEFQKMNAIYASTGYQSSKALAKIEPIFTGAKFKNAVKQLAAWGKTHHCTT